MQPKNWQLRAACRDADPELFFPLGDVFAAGEDKKGKAICRGCPVKAECLAWAVATGFAFGIAGGTTEAERRMLRRLAS